MARLRFAFAIAAAFAAAPALHARELYYGIGLSYGDATSDNVTGGSGESELRAGMLSLAVGQRFAAGSGFVAWEANADLSFGAETENTITGDTCSPVASGSYLCSHDATIRLVGVMGTSVGPSTEIFGTLGIGVVRGDFATGSTTQGSGTVTGATAGLGAQHMLSNGSSIRGEVIFDRFRNADQSAGFESDYDATTLRLSLVRKF